MTETRPLRAYAEVMLGRQRSPQHNEGPNMVRYLRAANVKDGSLDLADVKEMNFTPQEQTAFRLIPGDVLVTEGSGSLRAVGAAAVWNGELDGTVCFQNTLLRLRPRPSTDPRFLGWWCRFAFADGLFASVAVGANIFHVSADRVRALPMEHLTIQRQRAIVDFLDREVPRIDALIAAKHVMIGKLAVKRQAMIDAAMLFGGEATRVRHVVGRLTSGPRGWAEYVSPAGVPFLRITNVKATDIELDLSDLLYVQPPLGAERQRTMVATGDVVVSITAEIGSVGVARAGLAGAAVSQHLALMTPVRCSGDWLAYSLATSSAKAQLDAGRYGGTKTQLSLDDVRDVEIRIVEAELEVLICESLRSRLALMRRASTRLLKQIDLLTEHRQALITAAVTGQLTIPGVAA